jgi:hypothetical protein
MGAKDVAPGAIVESRISGPRVRADVHRERHYAGREIHAAVEAAGLELVAALGQEEVRGKVVLAEPPDEGRDHKIIHICALPRT